MLPQHRAHIGTVFSLYLQNQHSLCQHQWEGHSGQGLACSKAINSPGTLAVATPCILALSLRRDRLRTMTNVLGDALAAGIIAHVCEKDFAPKPVPQDPVSNTDKFPSAETSHLHPKDNVIEMIDETLLDQTGVHYNICQV